MLKGTFSIFVLLSASLCVRGQNPNLLVNSSFEGGFTGWVGTYGIWNVHPGHTINPGPISGANIGIVDAGQNAMRQTFATVPGVTYQLSFYGRIPDLDGNGIPIEGDSTGGPSDLRVSWNNQNFQHLLLQNRTAWNFYTLNFTADTSSSELEFFVPQYTSQTFQLSADTFIDNISVVAVPEPSFVALFAAGIALLGVRRLAQT